MLQGEYAQAKGFYERAVGKWEEDLGPDHGKVARALNGMAVVLRELVSVYVYFQMPPRLR